MEKTRANAAEHPKSCSAARLPAKIEDLTAYILEPQTQIDRLFGMPTNHRPAHRPYS